MLAVPVLSQTASPLLLPAGVGRVVRTESIQGVSAQAILRALLEGVTDPKVLADLAQGKLRNKRDQLERALKGKLTAHQHFMLSDLLIQLDFLDERIAAVASEFEPCVC